MSQTDIRNSNQYQQAPVKMRPSHSSAAEFHFLSLRLLRIQVDVAHVVMSLCHRVTVCLSVSRVKLPAQQILSVAEKF